jgi:hypothetical protein
MILGILESLGVVLVLYASFFLCTLLIKFMFKLDSKLFKDEE